MTAFKWIKYFMEMGTGTGPADGVSWLVQQQPDGWRIYSEKGYGCLMTEVKPEVESQ
jgi:hypothetical protein